MKIAAIILAAGESRRMGKQKLLLPYAGKPVIEHIVDEVTASKVAQTIVVTGHDTAAIHSILREKPVVLVENARYKEGMLSSVRCGLNAVPRRFRAFMVVLGDQPGIRAEIVDFLIDGFQKSDRGIVVPLYNDDTGHPIIISMKYRDEVLTKFDDSGLRGLIYGRPDEVLRLPVPFESVLRDMDTPEDYARELAALSDHELRTQRPVRKKK